MMRAAAEAAGSGTKVVAVTLLTSLSAAEIESIWGRSLNSVRDEVLRLAALSREAGVHGVVASALEARDLRRALGPDALVVTPGIRLAGGERHDQARVATPADAVEAGASHLVVGRAVTAAPDPLASMRAVRADMNLDAGA